MFTLDKITYLPTLSTIGKIRKMTYYLHKIKEQNTQIRLYIVLCFNNIGIYGARGLGWSLNFWTSLVGRIFSNKENPKMSASKVRT